MTRDYKKIELTSFKDIYLMIGLLGGLIPFLIPIFSGHILSSISYSYYESDVTRNIFVSFLCCIGMFFVCCTGYSPSDSRVNKVIGLCAILVAFNPCQSHDKVLFSLIPQYLIHYICAFILFSLLGYVCIFVFRKKEVHPTKLKIVRNRIYLACGITIWLSVATIALRSYLNESIYIPESTDLIPFAIAYFIKGEGFLLLND